MGLFTKIEHFAIASRDTEALRAWYCRVLGFETRVTFDNGPDKPKAFLIGLGECSMIEIVPADPAKPAVSRSNSDPGMVHTAILVSDFDAAVRELAAREVLADGPERVSATGDRVRFYRDPEGNLFHILKRR